MQISSSRYGDITLTPLVPDNIPGPLLPGSNSLFCAQDFGTILIQEYKTDHFSIRYSIFSLFKSITLFFKNDNAGVWSRVALKNSVNIQMADKHKLDLKEGQFILYAGNPVTNAISFENNREYRFFDTVYSTQLLEQLIASFPVVYDFINKDHLAESGSEIKQHLFTSAAMRETVYDILECSYDEGLRKFYFENKVRELLFELLVQSYKTNPIGDSLSSVDISSLNKARDIILNDLRKHFTIQQISRQVQLNEFKLKTGFKQQFGTGIFECLLQARMQKARDMLIDTDKPIKEIAFDTGYDHLTSFITAFRKYFGHTPGSIRRK
jgi:AraC-like DNA-binding protein